MGLNGGDAAWSCSQQQAAWLYCSAGQPVSPPLIQFRFAGVALPCRFARGNRGCFADGATPETPSFDYPLDSSPCAKNSSPSLSELWFS